MPSKHFWFCDDDVNQTVPAEIDPRMRIYSS